MRLSLSIVVLVTVCASPVPETYGAEGVVQEKTSQEVTALHGMVVSTTGPSAVDAGVGILKTGGSAADAAIATALRQVCLAAGSWVSYAGIMTLVYFDAAAGETYDMNAAYNTVREEADPKSIPGYELSEFTVKGIAVTDSPPSGRTALVPGFMAGVDAAHARFGKLTLPQIFAPAISCAEDGVEWSRALAGQFRFREKNLSRLPETRAHFFKADGLPYELGEIFKQPALADTLRKASTLGIRNYMYEGPWAEKFVAAVRRDGGKMTLEDLKSYRVSWSRALQTRYHGYDIHVRALPADGGVTLIESMRLADLAGLSSMGHYAESPQALFALTQIAKPAVLLDPSRPEQRDDIARQLGFDLSLEARLQPRTTSKLWEAMQAGKLAAVSPIPGPAVHSDAIVAVDQWGNVASMLHSINTISWGATGIFVDGVSVPDSAVYQRSTLAALKPGSRLPDATTPGIVTKDGKPYLGFNVIGSGLNTRTVAALISILDFGMSPQEANAQPSVGQFQFDPATNLPTKLGIGTQEFSADLLAASAKLGVEVVENNGLLAYWIGVMIDPNTGQLRAGPLRQNMLGSRAAGY